MIIKPCTENSSQIQWRLGGLMSQCWRADFCSRPNLHFRLPWRSQEAAVKPPATKIHDLIFQKNDLDLEPVYKGFRQYQIVLEKVSAAWTPPSSLQGRIHGVFRKRYRIRAGFLNTNSGYFVNNLLGAGLTNQKRINLLQK